PTRVAGPGWHDPSMEPSRERDGDSRTGITCSVRATTFNGAVARTRRRLLKSTARWSITEQPSMEPSRERDGDEGATLADETRDAYLQWSRRANATETILGDAVGKAWDYFLQWSRRANATETASGGLTRKSSGFLQWSRRANATET